VQTFLPFADFEETARSLDTRRLGKQRVETLQIVRALTRPAHGWRHHPAVRMWRGYEEALGAYGTAVCREWQRRGYADTCEAKITDELGAAGIAVPVRPVEELRQAGQLPPWLGDEKLHRSHRSALVRKDPDFYRPRLGDVPSDLPYVWPDGPPAAARPGKPPMR
jgi:pyrimidine dimer DNA glycosylase